MPKKRFFQKSFEENKNDGKKTWMLINDILNRKNEHGDKLPVTLKDNDNGRTFQGDNVSNGFNKYFS